MDISKRTNRRQVSADVQISTLSPERSQVIQRSLLTEVKRGIRTLTKSPCDYGYGGRPALCQLPLGERDEISGRGCDVEAKYEDDRAGKGKADGTKMWMAGVIRYITGMG